MESHALKNDNKSWDGDQDLEEMSISFKTYKMRFFGLTVIALCNIASSLNWLAVAPIPDYSNDFFGGVGLTAVNWFSNVFMLVYLFAGPLSSWVYEHWSIKMGVSFLELKRNYNAKACLDGHRCCVTSNWCLVTLFLIIHS